MKSYPICYLLILLFHFFAAKCFSQDLLITQNGDLIKAFELELSNKYCFYKESRNTDAKILRIELSNLLMIKYQNGEKKLFNIDSADEDVKLAKTETINSADVLLETPQPFNSIGQELWLDKYNKDNLIYTNNKKRGKKADMWSMQFYANENSEFENNDLQMEIINGILLPTTIKRNLLGVEHCSNFQNFEKVDASNYHYGYGSRPAIAIKIKNKTDNLIYINLEKSFFIDNNQAFSLYTPSSTSVSTSTSSGFSVNAGSVANALGINGAIGTIADGVNLGKGKGSEKTTIVHSQKIIMVPPYSSVMINPLRVTPTSNNYSFGNANNLNRRGDTIIYNTENSPIKWGFYVSYLFENNLEKLHAIKSEFYLKKIVAHKYDDITFQHEGTLTYNHLYIDYLDYYDELKRE